MNDNEFTYLRNVSYDEIGSISKDGGYTQLGADLDTSGAIDLLHDYVDSDGQHYLLAISNGKIYKYDSGSWTEITQFNDWVTDSEADADTESSSERVLYLEGDGDLFTADSKSSAVNRNGTAYIINELDGLWYTDGNSMTSAKGDNGGSEVLAKYITVVNGELYIANCSGVHSANNVLYTMGGGQTCYVPSEEGHDTYATTNNIITVNDAITGITGFQGTVIFFTEEAMYLFNPQNAEVMEIASIGCVDHNSIQEINGVLYWINRDGIYRFNGENIPELISLPIVNWATNSLWRLIDGGNWGDNPAVSFEGKYMVYIGDMSGTMPGDTGALSDIVLVYDTYRDVWYFLTDYPVRLMTRFVNSDGNLRLMMGSKDEAAVFQKGYTYTADGSAISMVVRTKYFNFDMPENEKVFSDFLATYRPEGESEKYLTVKIATNGTNNYEEIIGSTTNTKLELDGVLGTEFQLERAALKGTRGRALSYEFSNSDSGVNVTLLGYTQQYRYMNNNMNFSG
jgi:hypothetical protein